MVDSSPGNFESGLGGGQTKEHAILCRSLGISHVLVAVNKMDTVEWSESRFEDIRNQLGSFLAGLGFSFSFIPLSAFQGMNVTKPYS